MSYEIIYTDMVSESWQVLVKSPIIPIVGDLVNLPSEGKGRVLFVEHVYKVNRDEMTVLDYLKVYLDWKIA